VRKWLLKKLWITFIFRKRSYGKINLEKLG